MLDEIALACTLSSGITHEFSYAVELLIAGEDQEALGGLMSFLILFFDFVDGLPHKVEGAVARPGHWKVDNICGAPLMSSFYRNLKTMSKLEALRQAQLALIRGEGRSDLLARRGVGGIRKLDETPTSVLNAPSSDPVVSKPVSTSHPYFWALFILVGDGN